MPNLSNPGDSLHNAASDALGYKNAEKYRNEALEIKANKDDFAAEQFVKQTVDWISQNENANQEDFESKKSELESQASPIISKLYQDTNQNLGTGGMPSG